MKITASYIVVPIAVITVATMGSFFSSAGMPWYRNELTLPALTPPGWAFPVAWNIIFILGIIAAILGWERTSGSVRKKVAVLFIANGVLNAGWSLLFFSLHLILAALIEMILLEVTTLALVYLLWNRVRIVALLLMPYLMWVAFATYLTWRILALN